jgi:phage gp36-like protein
MAYCTQAQLNAAISTEQVAQLTDDTGGITVNAAHVTNAITKADKYIDLLLRGTHTVPFTVTPEPIGEISIDLSIRNLYERRPDLENPPGLKIRYDRSMDLLKRIAKGEIKIDDSTSFANTAGRWQANEAKTTRIYTSTYMDKY